MMNIKSLLTIVLLGQLLIGCSSDGNKNSQTMKLSSFKQSELVTIGRYIGVRDGKTVRFYNGDENWMQGGVSDFNIPSNADELITIGRYIGVRDGKTVRFYNGDGNWTQGGVPDFNIPLNADELITIGRYIGVKDGKTVRFYNGDGNWTQGGVPDFNMQNL